MTDSASVTISPGQRLRKLGPHRVGNDRYYAMARDMPSAATLQYDTASPDSVIFRFEYNSMPTGEAETAGPLNMVPLGEVAPNLSATIETREADRRCWSIQFSGWSADRWLSLEESGVRELFDRILNQIPTKTHLLRAVLISSMATTELAREIAPGMLGALGAALRSR